jgi:hypothetical protein
MSYTYQNEIANVKKYYEGDPLQKRYSLLLCGNSGIGKTSLLRTARKPIHVDSFDPGGTRCIRDMISDGDVIADTRFEDDDPYAPTRFDKWMSTVDKRLGLGYFDHFGTYMLDSATTWGFAVMAYQLKSRGVPGTSPDWKKDYTNQKTLMGNYIKKLMRIPCDFIMTGHFREKEISASIDSKTGVRHSVYEYRFYTTGQAVVTIPLLFDEMYVMVAEDTSEGLKRSLILEAQGKYHAKSRLKSKGLLDTTEPANLKVLLKKIGLSYEDKPKLDFTIPEEVKPTE